MPESAPPGGRKTVCVLDASSYAGLWIVKGLLLRGYAVHAALQNHGAGDSETATRKLREIGKDKEGLLKIFAADVLDYHSIVPALSGCSGLFYAFDQARDAAGYQEDMVEIEVRGAHNVLEACAQCPAVEKVVFASSVAAVVWRHHRNPADDDLIDERFWSDEDFCRKFKEERAAELSSCSCNFMEARCRQIVILYCFWKFRKRCRSPYSCSGGPRDPALDYVS